MDVGVVDEASGAGEPVYQLAGAQHLGVVEVAHLVLALGPGPGGEHRCGVLTLEEDAPEVLGQVVACRVLFVYQLLKALEPVGHHRVGHVVEVLGPGFQGGSVGYVVGSGCL